VYDPWDEPQDPSVPRRGRPRKEGAQRRRRSGRRMDPPPGVRPAWGTVQVGAAGRLVNPPWVYALDVSSDGRAAAAACGDGMVRTWALHAGEAERCLTLHRAPATCLAYPRFSPPHSLLSGGDDGRVVLATVDELEVHGPYASPFCTERALPLAPTPRPTRDVD